VSEEEKGCPGRESVIM